MNIQGEFHEELYAPFFLQLIHVGDVTVWYSFSNLLYA